MNPDPSRTKAKSFLVAIVISTIAIPTNAAEKNRSSAIPVSAVHVQRKDVISFVTGLGTIKPLNSATIRSRVDGQLVSLPFIEGQAVREGDLLAEIDPAPYTANLAATEAAKAKDDAILSNAQQDLGRFMRLADSGGSSAQQRDTAKSLVAQYEAIIKADQAQVDLARLQLKYCRILAPFDGRVGTRIIDPGNIVRASESTGIVIINQVQPIAAEFSIPGQTIVQVRQGLREGAVEVFAEDGKGRIIAKGRLVVVDNQISIGSATIKLKAIFENADEMLWPGLFVNVRLPLVTYRDVLTVPTGVIQQGPAGFFAFVVDNKGMVEKRQVKIGFSDQSTTVIQDGLKDGETVVTEGQYRIKAGSEVSIQNFTSMN